MSDQEIIDRLRQTYGGRILWIGNKGSVPKDCGDRAVVRLSIHPERFTMTARVMPIGTRKFGRPLEIVELEAAIKDGLVGGDGIYDRDKSREATKIGRRLIAESGGASHRVTSRYTQAAWTDGVSAWLRFSVGKWSRRRDWNHDRLQMLYSCGMCAWVVRLDMKNHRLQLRYFQNDFTTEWVGCTGAGLHMAVKNANECAVRFKWRETEMERFFRESSG